MARWIRILVPFSWTLWSILFLVLAWGFVDSFVHPIDTPEVSPQVGPMITGLFLLIWAGIGLLLFWAARRRSKGCLIALALLIAYFVFMLAAIVLVESWKNRQIESEMSRLDRCSRSCGAAVIVALVSRS